LIISTRAKFRTLFCLTLLAENKGMLSDEQVKKFQELYKKHFGEEIDKKDALKKSMKLLRLIQMIYKPMTQVEFEAVQKKREELNP
jgi:hypothetical protein